MTKDEENAEYIKKNSYTHWFRIVYRYIVLRSLESKCIIHWRSSYSLTNNIKIMVRINGRDYGSKLEILELEIYYETNMLDS